MDLKGSPALLDAMKGPTNEPEGGGRLGSTGRRRGVGPPKPLGGSPARRRHSPAAAWHAESVGRISARPTPARSPPRVNDDSFIVTKAEVPETIWSRRQSRSFERVVESRLAEVGLRSQTRGTVSNV